VETAAYCYDFREYVRDVSLVESERKLIQVQRQIGADDAALKQGPKRFDVVGMYVTPHLFIAHVTRGFAPLICLSEKPIARVFIGRDQTHAGIHGLPHKLVESRNFRVLDRAAGHVVFSRDRDG